VTAIPRFYRSATPSRDHAPLIGTDTEFMAFLAEARRRRADAQAHSRSHGERNG
jgi:hypothetical protein